MRTKLDEIVEEEFNVAPAFRIEARAIAEEAFRHGAERHALWAKSVVDASPNIVPAPAEEKRAPSACDCGWCEGTSEAPCEVAKLAPNVFDRRKGERRKGLEVCPHAPEYTGRCFVYTKLDGTVLHAGDSRHKDRRKP